MKDRDLPGEWEGSSGACRRDGEVLLGVTGCIGAYKAAEVVRLLRRRDMGVQVVMTRHAGWFMTSGTLETLSGRPVLDHLFKPRAQGSMEHIELARRADLFLVAPATANCVGKFAAGIADDLLSTIHLAFKGPVVLAPAMNTGMYRHPAVQRNLEILERRGVRLLGPDQGELACGETGPGRLVPPEFIVQEVVKILGRKSPRSPLAGRSVLVSAGPTREPIDAVRFLTSPATGRMGYALAAAARERGAKVVLVSGPTPLAAPEDVDVIRVQTVEQMREALLLHFRSSDLVVMAAAVGDFRVATPGRGKLKKADVPATLHLVATPDILAEMGQEKGGSDRPVLIGFAAETENLDEHGREKMGGKNLDYLVANKVDVPESGFGSTTNRVVVFCRDGRADRWPLLTKKEVADRLLDQVILEKFSIPVPGDRPVA